MSAEIKWNDRFNIGVASIDHAHQKLFSIVGKLVALNEDETKQQHACKEGIKYFKSYTLKHFADEEAYMQSINYSGYAMHKIPPTKPKWKIRITLRSQYSIFSASVPDG